MIAMYQKLSECWWWEFKSSQFSGSCKIFSRLIPFHLSCATWQSSQRLRIPVRGASDCQQKPPESCPRTFGRQLNYQPFFKDINELFEFHKEKKPLFDARIKTALVQDQCWPIVVCLLGKIRMVILHVFVPTNKWSPDPFYFIASKG